MHIDTGPVRNWDLDQKDRGTLLVGDHKIAIRQARRDAGREGQPVPSKMPAVLRGEGPLSVRDRLARLRKLARAEYLARAK